jgi:hypothetical protein
LHWRCCWPTTSIWDGGIDALLAVHGHGGASVITWLDDSAESSSPTPGRTRNDFEYPLATGLRVPTASVDGRCVRCLAAWPCVTCPDPKPPKDRRAEDELHQADAGAPIDAGVTAGDGPMTQTWYSGNANDDADEYRGWLLGHFIEPTDDVRATNDVEVKWGNHPARERRSAWTSGDQRTTLLILVDGRFRLDLSEATVTLARRGDYVVWGPGIDHSWQAEDNSVVITVRWPSVPH